MQPPSTCAFDGSPRIAKSPVNRSGRFLREPPEPVELRRDLLVVVPHPGEVDDGVDELRRELELHGDARLHVDGAAPPEVALAVDGLEPRRQVVVDRHGVEVPGDHDAALAAEVRARDDGVAVADHLEVGGPREGLDHEVGEAGLVARDARHVADRPRDRHRVGGEVERWHGRGGSRHATSLRIRVRRSRAGARPTTSRMPRAAAPPIRWSHARHHRHRLLPCPSHRVGPRAGDGRRRRHRARHLVPVARARSGRRGIRAPGRPAIPRRAATTAARCPWSP